MEGEVLALVERSAIKVSKPNQDPLVPLKIQESNPPSDPTELPSNMSNHESADWLRILPKLKLTGLALNAAENATIAGKNEGELSLAINKGHQSLFTSQIKQRIEQAWNAHFQESIKIILVCNEASLLTPAHQKQIEKNAQQQEAEAQMQQDPVLKKLQQEFSAVPVKDTIILVE